MTSPRHQFLHITTPLRSWSFVGGIERGSQNTSGSSSTFLAFHQSVLQDRLGSFQLNTPTTAMGWSSLRSAEERWAVDPFSVKRELSHIETLDKDFFLVYLPRT